VAAPGCLSESHVLLRAAVAVRYSVSLTVVVLGSEWLQVVLVAVASGAASVHRHLGGAGVDEDRSQKETHGRQSRRAAQGEPATRPRA
jgi:hypothetical protein